MDKLAHEDHTIVISCEMDLKWVGFRLIIFNTFIDITPTSLDYLTERMWADLGLVRIYTKKRGAHPDLHDPVCLRKGATIEVKLTNSSSMNLTDTSHRTCVMVFIARLQRTSVMPLSG